MVSDYREMLGEEDFVVDSAERAMSISAIPLKERSGCAATVESSRLHTDIQCSAIEPC